MVLGSVLMAMYLICNMKRLTIQTPVTCLSAKLMIPCYFYLTFRVLYVLLSIFNLVQCLP
jgi:hypothetical protein